MVLLLSHVLTLWLSDAVGWLDQQVHDTSIRLATLVYSTGGDDMDGWMIADENDVMVENK